MIPVVDIFAGPGGLSEGFTAVTDHRGNSTFDVVLSIEMEQYAFETLKLRAFYRQFPEGPPDDYYRYLRKEISLNALYEMHPQATTRAEKKCWQAKLGPEGQPEEEVRGRIDHALNHG